LDPFQVVQKPSFESFQVPSFFAPPLPIGSRVIFPSVVNTILYLMFVVAAVNGCPVKNVAWISAGASAAAELGCVPMRVTVAANNKARISDSP
jgi:hypothetical protein